MQGVCRPRKSLKGVNLSEVIEDCCCRSAQGGETLTLRCRRRFSARSAHKKFFGGHEKSRNSSGGIGLRIY
jgi:hypothetical protein